MIRVGTTGTIKMGAAFIDGARVIVVSISKVTGGLTVRLLSKHRAYQKGDRINIQSYEFKAD